MKTTLYSITEEQRYLLSEIEQMEGEITPEMEEQLIITAHQLDSKSIAYLEVIKNRESFISTIDDEIKRLQQLKKTSGNLVTRLKDNLLHAVKTFGDYEVGLSKFGTRKSTSVEVEDVNALPKEYKVIKVTEQADKIAIKKALQSGVEIEGCYLSENLNLKIN